MGGESWTQKVWIEANQTVNLVVIMDGEVELAKKIITEEVEKAGLKVREIILFGSRAREEYRKDSDWDFLVILNQDISFQELKRITADIQFKLATLNMPNDLILRGINQFEVSRKVVGNISYFADKEGIKI